MTDDSPDVAMTGWRIDDLARRAELTVDTVRFYQREGLLPAGERVGRSKQYSPEHLEQIRQIRDLQARRFSLAAIKALLESERQDLVDGIFAGEGGLSYSLDDLVERSGLAPALVERLRVAGLLRDPAEFGRDVYDANDLDVLRALAELHRLLLPDDILIELVTIYVRGVETMQSEVLELKANPNRTAKGNVIESGLEPGGPTATVLVRKGTLRVGNIVICGQYCGKVRALINEEGNR